MVVENVQTLIALPAIMMLTNVDIVTVVMELLMVAVENAVILIARHVMEMLTNVGIV